MAIATRPKPTVHHKKAAGKHHRHDKSYLKSYWPYLPILAVVGVGLVINASFNSATKAVLGDHTGVVASALLDDTNAQRTADKETPLLANSQLTAAATAKAQDMVKRNYWSHVTPDGTQPWAFIAQSGYQYRAAGENLAYGFADANDVVNGWMHSAEHRANILDSGFQDVGFGIASSNDFKGNGPTTVVVALYGTPGTVTTAVAHPASLVRAPLEAQAVSRLQLETGGESSWLALTVSTLASIALVTILVRHSIVWRRAFRRGEVFVLTHPIFDIGMIGLITFGLLASHAAGFIH